MGFWVVIDHRRNYAFQPICPFCGNRVESMIYSEDRGQYECEGCDIDMKFIHEFKTHKIRGSASTVIKDEA